MSWTVYVPFTGHVAVTIENAEDEADAISQAFDMDDLLTDSEGLSTIQELEFHHAVVKGNVFYGDLDEVYAEDEEVTSNETDFVQIFAQWT